jgi:uncharacterized protein YfaS (alpha-2-macroglobulin family)
MAESPAVEFGEIHTELRRGAKMGAGLQAPPERVRQFFPEALLWRPELVTDESGAATLVFPVADSVTAWRVSAVAGTAAGGLGFGDASFRAFQEFFVEPDLPPVLTQGDRIDLPVAVYNFLDRDQRVVVLLDEEDDWYALEGERRRVVPLGPKEVRSVAFDLTARRAGIHALTVRAWGQAEGSADAVRRAVTVYPDGRERTDVANLRLSGPATLPVEAPPGALPGTARLGIKVYPGMVGSVLDGLEGMMRRPYG